MHLIHRQTCRICGSRELVKVIDLGQQRLQGTFHKDGERAPVTRAVDCALVRCDPTQDELACGLLQMAHTVPSEILYDSYWYRSGTNQTMRDHLANIAATAVGMFPEGHAGEVLDIGCNDGTLLRAFPEPWIKVGVDPCDVAQRNAKDLTVVQALFPSETFDKKCPVKKFDVVTSIAMFYDVDEPMRFAREVACLLKNDGVWIVEVSYLASMLFQNSYDTICAEHLEYYSLSVLEGLMRRCGLEIVRVELNDCNGGSIRCYVAKPGSRWANNAAWRAELKELRRTEFNFKLDTNEPYLDFQHRVDTHARELHALLTKLKADGKRVHIYGASTKGNTILQFCKVDGSLVECAADRNPDKWGAVTPATEIRIVSEEASRAEKPDYYLVLPWHFRDEFLRREAAMLAAGTKLIFPLPNIEVIGHDDVGQRHELANG